jgi:hypothetical protein
MQAERGGSLKPDAAHLGKVSTLCPKQRNGTRSVRHEPEPASLLPTGNAVSSTASLTGPAASFVVLNSILSTIAPFASRDRSIGRARSSASQATPAPDHVAAQPSSCRRRSIRRRVNTSLPYVATRVPTAAMCGDWVSPVSRLREVMAVAVLEIGQPWLPDERR